MPKIIVITGPTGSGKSTVTKALCQKFPLCVRIDIDRVKHFVESGFLFDESEEGEKQWDLCAKNVIMLANNFINKGYVVIIEGYFDDRQWKRVATELDIVHKFLLLPKQNVTCKRDEERDPRYQMGCEAIKNHYSDFTREFFGNFERIDSSQESIDETVERIFSVV